LVSCWSEFDEVPEAYRPQAIWNRAKTVIVSGVPMLLPIIESTPSISYTVMHDTSNVLVDEAANRLAILLNSLWHASLFMPRRPGRPAGEDRMLQLRLRRKIRRLGTIGYNHLLNPKYNSPRSRYVSILFDAIGCTFHHRQLLEEKRWPCERLREGKLPDR
jgi:epoxyqueuosine reductase